MREQPIILSVLMHGSGLRRRRSPKVPKEMSVVFFGQHEKQGYFENAHKVYKKYTDIGSPKNKDTILGMLAGMTFKQKDPVTQEKERVTPIILTQKGNKYHDIVFGYHGMHTKKNRSTKEKINAVPPGSTGEGALEMSIPYGVIEGIPEYHYEPFTEEKFMDTEAVLMEEEIRASEPGADTFVAKHAALKKVGGTPSEWKHLYEPWLRPHRDDVLQTYTQLDPSDIIRHRDDFTLSELLSLINIAESGRVREGKIRRSFIILVYSCRASCAS